MPPQQFSANDRIPPDPGFERTDEHRRVEDLFHHTSRNFLVLGSAGTGKSFLLRRLVENSRKRVIVVAYTGLAAIQAGGQTINSFFNLRPGLQPRQNISQLGGNVGAVHRFSDLDAILIDEVSMLRSDLFDALEFVLREQGPRPGEPFGGIQIGVFGDPLQLPPIVSTNEQQAFNGNWDEGWPSAWFCDALAYRTGNFVRVTLKRVFRQDTDRDFADFLGRLRVGQMQPQDLPYINARVSRVDSTQAMALVTTNSLANQENDRRYSELPGSSKTWYATDQFWPEHWRDDEPVPRVVEIKVGSRVLVCANRAGPGLVNGSIGTVSKMEDDTVYLWINGGEVPVRVFTWEFPIWDWDGKERKMVQSGVARYTQMPLKHAWALTIHKAQGQTINGPVCVDLGNRVWSGGQTYVALSRVRQLEHLHLSRPIGLEDVLVERRAMAFLAEGDTPTTMVEFRAKASEIFQQTRRLRDDVEYKHRVLKSEREELQLLIVEIRRLAAEVKASENRIEHALQQARKVNWINRLLGRF